jgi:hypothetical protein
MLCQAVSEEMFHQLEDHLIPISAPPGGESFQILIVGFHHNHQANNLFSQKMFFVAE